MKVDFEWFFINFRYLWVICSGNNHFKDLWSWFLKSIVPLSRFNRKFRLKTTHRASFETDFHAITEIIGPFLDFFSDSNIFHDDHIFDFRFRNFEFSVSEKRLTSGLRVMTGSRTLSNTVRQDQLFMYSKFDPNRVTCLKGDSIWSSKRTNFIFSIFDWKINFF